MPGRLVPGRIMTWRQSGNLAEITPEGADGVIVDVVFRVIVDSQFHRGSERTEG